MASPEKSPHELHVASIPRATKTPVMNRTEMRPEAARSRGGKTAMPPDRQSAITLEDDDPLAYVGGEAFPPIDTGSRGPAGEDLDPAEGLTPEQLAEEEASASVGDLEFSEEETEQ
jgi:hypothetical protein